MTLRVGVNLCWLVPGVVGGSEESTTRTLRAIADAGDPDLEVVLFAQPEFADAHPDLVARFETHLLPVRATLKPLRVGLEHVWLPRKVEKLGIDVLHDAGGTSPGTVGCPRVLTVHDIQPLDQPRWFNPVKVAYLRRALPPSAERAAVVAVPSTFVADRLVDRLGTPRERIAVVPWPVPPHQEAAPIGTVRAQLGIIGKIVLLPAITYPHKEHVVAIRAMRHLAERHKETTLVLTGGEGPNEKQVLAEIESLGLTDRVVRTGRVTPTVLAALYEHASALVWPSVYEGFGNPVLEAMSLGVPVIVANAGSSPELVGDAGAVIPPGDDAQLAIELHRVLDDDEWRERMIRAGRDRAASYSPARTADLLVDCYRRAAASCSEPVGL